MDNVTPTNQESLNLDKGSDDGIETSQLQMYNCNPVDSEQAPLTNHLMEQIVDLDNLRKAYMKVVANKGACGIDGMTVEDMYAWCQQNIGELIELLMNGRYKPAPVRGVQIPKAGGGQRQLGIPTVIDPIVIACIGHGMICPIDFKEHLQYRILICYINRNDFGFTQF